MGQVSIKKLFADMQKTMLQRSNLNKHITHNVEKGDFSEEEWIRWFREYIPKRYAIDKAIIIDNTGATSEQIDVVIYDRQYSPLVFNYNGFKYIPAESLLPDILP